MLLIILTVGDSAFENGMEISKKFLRGFRMKYTQSVSPPNHTTYDWFINLREDINIVQMISV